MHGEYDFDFAAWDAISMDAIDFVSQLLQVDPSRRPDAGKAMRHPWLRKNLLLPTVIRQVKDDDDKGLGKMLREVDFKRVALNVCQMLRSSYNSK